VTARRLRHTAAGLLLAATAMITVGTVIERADNDHHDAAGFTQKTHSVSITEANETADHQESAAPHADAEQTHDEARVLGIPTESTVLFTLAVALSVLLAAAVVVTSRRSILVTFILVTLGFTVLGFVEMLHQIDLSNSTLAAITAAAAFAHGASSAGAGASLRRSS
jgi:hypothetical protein